MSVTKLPVGGVFKDCRQVTMLNLTFQLKVHRLYMYCCVFLLLKTHLRKVQTERYMNGVVEGGGTVKRVFLHVCVFWQVGLSLSESLIPRILRFLPIFPR